MTTGGIKHVRNGIDGASNKGAVRQTTMSFRTVVGDVIGCVGVTGTTHMVGTDNSGAQFGWTMASEVGGG
jgi:hypothetical protein